MERATQNNINPDLIEMVNRFNAIPADRNVKHCIQRYKMMDRFKIWFTNHVDQLTKEEREYLQANICPVRTYLDEVKEEPKEIDPWD